MLDRKRSLDRLTSDHFDLLIVGGGITGCGIALDGASRGLKVALIDKGDFASGTSSKSSKLVHGGLRYLEQHEFKLVYESLHERQRLLSNASYLVEPQPFLIPLFGKGGIADKTVARTYATALWIYDITGGLRIGKAHKRVSRDQALAHLPTLKTDRLAAGFIYYDARVDDARLTLEIAKTAAERFGATIANYVQATQVVKDDSGKICGVTVAGEEIAPGTTISARVVVNSTGVWADELRETDEGELSHSIRPAKGIHIAVPSTKLPCDIASVIPVKKDRRSIFIIPWAWGGQTYIGTTDTDYTGPLDDPECTPQDVAYLLDAVNTFLTEPISSKDIIGIWAGLRPLVASGSKSKSSRTADLSRRHHIFTSPSGLITITGGKLTTYRQMAQDCVDMVVAALGRPKVRCQTKNLALLGAGQVDEDSFSELVTKLSLSQDVATTLRRRYGSRAIDVLGGCVDNPSLAEPMVVGTPYILGEISYAIKHEMAQTIEDVVARRTRALLINQPGLLESLEKISQVVANGLGWDEDTRKARVEEFMASTRKRSEFAGLVT